MEYTCVRFLCDPDDDIITDVLAENLSGIGFETFMPILGGLEAYVPSSVFSEEKIHNVIANFYRHARITYAYDALEDKNWNEEWEKNYFQPITIDDRCVIHSSFHHPQGDYHYRILIDPKMSFGTGHHQTTGLILREILDMDVQGKSALDMGCGTAVLAILARKCGAYPVLAVDIDEWAYNNALENIRLNNTGDIEIMSGGAERLHGQHFDLVFANINRNVLLNDMPLYVETLNVGGTLVMSGFFDEDVSAIRRGLETCGLTYVKHTLTDDWAAVTATR